jgi:serine/threonine protein kinase/Flp pilus assembly protein TadD
MPLAPHTQLGPYLIINTVGAGGMGEVYRARDPRLDRDVAIKVLPESLASDAVALARFNREVKAVASLSHPNILTIYDIGTQGTIAYAVMELLEGCTLGRMLRSGPLGWSRALEIASAVAAGLAAAHAKGVVHRDLKPENLFITSDGGVKILDFGLARIQSANGHDSESGDQLATRPGMLLGTVAYMSPEQVRGQLADARSDIFAFGCLLYEMVLGRRPFARPTTAETMAAILNEAPTGLSQSGRHRPAELDRIILRCLNKDANLRWQSAKDISAALGTLGRSAVSGFVAYSADGETVAEAQPLKPPSSAASPPSVAVLPFQNLSSDIENEYFSDGLAEELINALTKIAGLRVASRTSAFAFKGKHDDVRRIGEKLSVRAVLEGSVRKAGNRLRISAQLVNVADGFHLWSEVFNRELEDVFQIQDEITLNIVKALRGILTDSERQAIEKEAPADIHAYDYYLRGRQFFHQFSKKGFEFARQMFLRAIALDPRYARAHAGAADCYSLLFTYWDTNPANLEQADKSSRLALELEPGLAEAHVARGLAVSLKKQYAEAEEEFLTAARLDPTLFEARYFHARTCLSQGKLLEAARLFEQAVHLRPDDYQASSHLSSIYAGLGRKADAEAGARRCIQVVQRQLELHPEDARATYLGAVACCLLGEGAKALEWIERAVAMDPDEPVTQYNAACVFALQGRVEEAIACLQRALKLGFAHKEWIENDADLASLRSHPQYAGLLKSL